MQQSNRAWVTTHLVLLTLLPATPSGASTSSATQASGCDGVVVPPGSSIANAVASRPPGTTFCLAGLYTISQTVISKDGNRFIGPATIVGRTETGFTNGSRVLYQNLDMSGFSRQAIRPGPYSKIVGGRIHGNPRTGIGGGAGGVVVQGTEVDHNGSHAKLGCCSGGIKTTDPMTVIDVYAHDNIGNGIWCDISCGAFTVKNSLVVNNSWKGIFVETSQGPSYIAGNTVIGNNWMKQNTAGGIVYVSSKNGEITNNYMKGNHLRGFHAKNDKRAGNRGYFASNIKVHHNTGPDPYKGCDLPGVDCWANG